MFRTIATGPEVAKKITAPMVMIAPNDIPTAIALQIPMITPSITSCELGLFP